MATKSLTGPPCCNFASRASANCKRFPPGKNRFPAAASNTTGLSPTTVICRSPAPLRSSQVLDSVDVASPSALAVVTVTTPGPDRHCKSGYRPPPRRPCPAMPPAPVQWLPHRSRSPWTERGPKLALRRVCHGNDSVPKLTSAEPGNCLSPPRRMFAGETWFNVEPVSSSTNTSPALWRISNVVLAGVTAPSSTRDG